jgi:glycosyltransferase involved in cell wall biosynthesis
MTSEIEKFFDESFYALSGEARKQGMRPFDHYIKQGEALGYAPSARFDPKYYAKRYPDVASAHGGLLKHFVRHGLAEGRTGVPPRYEVACATAGIRKNRPTILIVLHEATRTGAPVLGWNLIGRLAPKFNVVSLLMKGGPLEAALEEVSTAMVRLPGELSHGSDEATQLIRKIVAVYAPIYAIANSAATRDVAMILEDLDIPVVSLVHEFSSDFRPTGRLHGLYLRASKVVFPARIVAVASEKDYYILRSREHEIAPQGPSRLPKSDRYADSTASLAMAAALSSIDKGSFLVAGMGTVTYRKGVDVFIATAADLFRQRPDIDCRFIWVGHTFPFDAKYREYLHQQIQRSGLDGRVILLNEVTDLDPIYQRADAFVLSSRLDPLPNVAIDAALRGLPIICFENASGIAEILENDVETRTLIVPYLDAAAAARAIRRLIEDRKHLANVSKSIRTRARSTFNMTRYIDTLQRLGQDCVEDKKQRARDQKAILKSGVFDAGLCFGPDASERPLPDSISRYLKQSRLARPLARARSGLFFRRPMPGFNPLIYASDCPEFRSSKEDPLAHFLRSGRPAGRWTHQVIVPAQPKHRPKSGDLRVALHGHFHYPDLVQEFLERLSLNRTKMDLFLTTTAKDKATEIRKVLRRLGIKHAEVAVVANRGRDIGPFLEKFRNHENIYDVIGHLHGKKSPHVDSAVGDRWREFMLQHLLGGASPMADVILRHFADDPKLGLVFPEDPHLNDWDENREMGDALARRMKISMPLPTHFDFPVGAMFWVRPRALKPMFNLRLTQQDYPPEPLPIDGTILHALERLVSFSNQKAGYRYATTHVPSCLR